MNPNRLSWDALEQFARLNYTPAAVGVWLCQVSDILKGKPSPEGYDAILCSAPLAEEDVTYLQDTALLVSCDEEAPEHPEVDYSDCDRGDEVKVAAVQLLAYRTRELLESPVVVYLSGRPE